MSVWHSMSTQTVMPLLPHILQPLPPLFQYKTRKMYICTIQDVWVDPHNSFRAHVSLCERVSTGKPGHPVIYQSVWSHSH